MPQLLIKSSVVVHDIAHSCKRLLVRPAGKAAGQSIVLSHCGLSRDTAHEPHVKGWLCRQAEEAGILQGVCGCACSK